MSKSLLASFLITSAVVLAAVGGLSVLSQHPDDGPPISAPSAARAEEAAPVNPPRVIRLDEVRIVARPARRKAVAPGSRSRSRSRSRTLVPCSDWKDLGPVYSVHAGETPRTRHVRLMCSAR